VKAIVIEKFGTPDVMSLEEVDTPEPGPEEVLIEVKASSVNPYDWHFLTGLPKIARPSMGGRTPIYPVLGADWAGVISDVGEDVVGWKPGDEVFGQRAYGAWAEYLTIGQDWLVRKPANLTFEEAAAVPLAGTTALQAIRDQLSVKEGESVLVNGASGGVGTFAVQIAADLGAVVTGVCSTRNLELVESLGAARVIDYTQQDLRDVKERFDNILDLVGNHSVRRWRKLLAKGGTYLASHGQPEKEFFGPMGWLMRMKLSAMLTRTDMKLFTAKSDPRDWRSLATRLEEGSLRVVLDRTFSLEQVPDAIRYLEDWHVRGKVAITIP
jgi:NADPH:quinone reductase-like Zn-dependent oxidoreductase